MVAAVRDAGRDATVKTLDNNSERLKVDYETCCPRLCFRLKLVPIQIDQSYFYAVYAVDVAGPPQASKLTEYIYYRRK